MRMTRSLGPRLGLRRSATSMRVMRFMPRWFCTAARGNAAQEYWMGWERKRGKLENLPCLILGHCPGLLSCARRSDIRCADSVHAYVVTFRRPIPGARHNGNQQVDRAWRRSLNVSSSTASEGKTAPG